MRCHLYNLAGNHISTTLAPTPDRITRSDTFTDTQPFGRTHVEAALQRAAGRQAELLHCRQFDSIKGQRCFEGVFSVGPLVGCFLISPSHRAQPIDPDRIVRDWQGITEFSE